MFEDSVMRLAVHRNLLVVVWFGPPTIEHVSTMERAARELLVEHPGKTGLLNVAIGDIPSLDGAMRAEVARIARDRTLVGVGIAHLILTPGPLGSALRVFMSTVILVSKPPFPMRMLPSLDVAAAWLEPKLNAVTPGWTKAEIVAAGKRAMKR